MAIGPIISRGYGLFGLINLLITRGYLSAPSLNGTIIWAGRTNQTITW